MFAAVIQSILLLAFLSATLGVVDSFAIINYERKKTLGSTIHRPVSVSIAALRISQSRTPREYWTLHHFQYKHVMFGRIGKNDYAFEDKSRISPATVASGARITNDDKDYFVGGAQTCSSSSVVEMAARMTASQIVSLIGILYAIGIVVILAMDRDSILATIEATSDGTASSYLPEFITDLTTDNLFHATDNIIDIAMPPLNSPSEAVIMTLGEGIAGIIGSIASFCLSLAVMYNNNQKSKTDNTGERKASGQGGIDDERELAMTKATNDIVKKINFNSNQLTPTTPKKSIFDTLDTTGTLSTTIAGSTSTTPAEEAVAGSDFFLAQAATLSIAESIGLSPFYASIVSVLLATIPYELIKVSSRRARLQLNRMQEDELLMKLLQEEDDRKRNSKLPFLVGFPTKRIIRNKTMDSNDDSDGPSPYSRTNYPLVATKSTATSAVVGTQPPPTTTIFQKLDRESPTSVMEFDAVEVFSDVTKWLEYSVLRSEFKGTFNMFLSNEVTEAAASSTATTEYSPMFEMSSSLLMTMDNVVESAMFGIFAATSAQLYADLLYGWFGFGGTLKKSMVRTRSVQDWSKRYITVGISSATLFGIYEAAQKPVTDWIASL